MLRHAVRWVVSLSLVALLSACDSLPEAQAPGSGGGTVASDLLPSTDAVPRAWGDLVTVVYNPRDALGSSLWFQDDAGNLRVVRLDNVTHRLNLSVTLIRRN